MVGSPAGLCCEGPVGVEKQEAAPLKLRGSLSLRVADMRCVFLAAEGQQSAMLQSVQELRGPMCISARR